METGCHPWNRSSSAIVPAKVAEKVTNFYKVGLSLLECSKAVAVGRARGPAGDAREAANIEIAKQSEGILAAVAQGSLSQFSITCNHTSQAVRVVICEAQHCDPEIAPTGAISRGLLEQRDAVLAKTIRHGLDWLWIDPIVEEKIPALIRLIIEADNIPHAIAAKDTSGTLLWKCYEAIHEVFNDKELSDMSDKDKWSFIEAKVLRSEMGRESDVAHYLEFTKLWAGGVKDPFVLRELDEFTKGLSKVRDFQAQMIGKLAKLNLGAGQGPDFTC